MKRETEEFFISIFIFLGRFVFSVCFTISVVHSILSSHPWGMAFGTSKWQDQEDNFQEPWWGHVQGGMVYFCKQAGGGTIKIWPFHAVYPFVFPIFLPVELLLPFFNLAFLFKTKT